MNITYKVSITKDQNTRTPFIYVMEQNSAMRSGRQPVSFKDLLILQKDIAQHLIDNTNYIMGKEGNIHMLKYENYYALKFSKQGWILHISKHDILPLYNEITRTLADIDIDAASAIEEQPKATSTNHCLDRQQLNLL